MRPFDEMDQRAVAAMRVLAVDEVEQARSGHPGMPLGASPMAYVLWSRFLRHDPADPAWPDRDRFVLSAGHASAMLYALLHLFGYGLPIEELKRFRQWGSKTPGHPEHGLTPGVETTTGPLGQGLATAVGMALAERHLAARFNRDGMPVVGHRTWVIASDGDMMEGISHEAASLAGHLRLGRLTVLYDDNRVTIEGLHRPRLLRGRGGAFRRVRVAHVPRRRRQRPRRHRGGARAGGRRRGRARPRPRPHPHRLGQSQAGQLQGARRAARAGGGRRDPRGAGVDDRGAVRHPRGDQAALPRARATGRGAARRLGGAARALPADAPRRRRRARAPSRRRAAGRVGRGVAFVPPGVAARDPPGLRQDPERPRAAAPGAVRRRGRPRPLDRHAARRRGLRRSRVLRGPQPALRHPRARDGRGRERRRAARRDAGVRRDVLRLLRLPPARDAAGGADEAAGDLRVHPRLHRSRRGRPDAPAGRAHGRAAGDPEHGRAAPRRRQRDRPGVAGGARAPRRAHRARAHPAEAAGAPAAPRRRAWRAARTSAPRRHAARPRPC